MKLVVLSASQANFLLAARGSEAVVKISCDLGLSTNEVSLDTTKVILPGGAWLPWEGVLAITGDPNGCYVVEQGTSRKIQFYSPVTGRVFSLYPTSGAPTMLVSGIPMHRIKDTEPYQDTREKIRSIRPVVGKVLDTATGLGYTAIEAAKTADQVVTIELDPAALEVARLNPWSNALFEDPKITQVIGDSFEEVGRFADGSFTRILHDPPAFSLAGDLYSGEIYRQLYRVLRNGGRMFHYIGDPESKSGRRVTAGVIRRLEEAGFRRVERAPRAFGVVAYK